MHGEKRSQMKHYEKYAHNAKYYKIQCFMRPNVGWRGLGKKHCHQWNAHL